MISQSGCFGTRPNNDTIDNAAELSAAVDEIVTTVTADPGEAAAEQEAAAYMMAQHYAFMTKRVRMLTWAVVALAAYIVIKETV